MMTTGLSKTDPAKFSYGSVLEPDQPVPLGPKQAGAGTPWHSLALRVVENALKDLGVGAAHSRRRRILMLRKRADWYGDLVIFFRHTGERWGTLKWWCAHCGLDDEYMRDQLAGEIDDLERGLVAAGIRHRLRD